MKLVYASLLLQNASCMVIGCVTKYIKIAKRISQSLCTLWQFIANVVIFLFLQNNVAQIINLIAKFCF